MDLMTPEFEGIDPQNPFDLWEGLNFNLRCKKKDDFRNYDASDFDDEPSPVAESDAEIEKIWKSEYSLSEFTNPEHFKSYEELQAELHRAMGKNQGTTSYSRKNRDSENGPSERDTEVDQTSFGRNPKKTTRDFGNTESDEEADEAKSFISRIKRMVDNDDDIPF
jgi:hypothetical protein